MYLSSHGFVRGMVPSPFLGWFTVPPLRLGLPATLNEDQSGQRVTCHVSDMVGKVRFAIPIPSMGRTVYLLPETNMTYSST